MTPPRDSRLVKQQEFPVEQKNNLSPITVGVDPDSDRHGIAIYEGKTLAALNMMNLVELREWLNGYRGMEGRLHFAIENVLAQNFVYQRNRKSSRAAENKIAVSIGRVQQAQVEVVRELEHRDISYQLINPTGANWAKQKELFEARTGWTGASNADTRSAAYFGWYAVKFPQLRKPRSRADDAHNDKKTGHP